MTWRIYILKEPAALDVTQPVRYVGYTKQSLQVRLYNHVKDACRLTASGDWLFVNHRSHWLRKLLSSGFKPDIEEIESGEEPDGWREREIHWIKHYKALGVKLVNTSEGGVGPTGCTPTAATRLKLSAALRQIWSRPDQREKRLAGLQRKDTNDKRTASIRQAYTNLDLIRISSARLGDPVNQAKRRQGFAAAVAEGRIGNKPQYTSETLALCIQAYFANEGCLRCLGEKYQVSPSAILQHLRKLGVNIASRKGGRCGLQGSYHIKRSCALSAASH